MYKKLFDFVANNAPSLDLLLLTAVMINTVFIGIYTYEYEPRGTDYILYASFPSYVFSVICGLVHVLRPTANKKNFSVCWTLCVLYALVSLPLYSVLISNGKKYLILNMSASLFLLAMMCNWIMFIFLLISGFIVSMIISGLTVMYIGGEIMTIPKKKYLVLYIMSYTVIFLAIFMRKKERIQEKKLDFMKVFGGAIAHEVNAPLAAMKMMADVMDSIFSSIKVRRKGENFLLTLDSTDYEMLNTVIRPNLKQSSSDAIQITEMLLSALRDKYTNTKASVKIGKIVKAAVEMASHLDPEYKRINIKENQEFEVVCNKKLLKHVIYNLIKNSFKHGGENVKVLIEINHREIIVSDDGVGIPQEKIDMIFKAFFTNGNGSGIGLAFAEFVLDDINATISCESEINKFTKFIITFN